MKKIALALLIIPILISCNHQKVKQLELRNDSLVQQATLKDESITEFLQSFSEIQNNLDSIKTKEMIISDRTEGKTELKKKAKDQINDDIKTIYLLLTDTQDKLAEIRKKLGKSNYHVKELQKVVDHLSKQLAYKDKEIEGLRLTLEKMNIKVIKLAQSVNNLKKENIEKDAQIQDQTDVIDEKTLELNTAYYAIGTKKELKENNIITAEGGFIGIGKNKKLKADFNEEFFTKIDIREASQIPIPGTKKATVVSTHGPDSYNITGEGDSRILEIVNIEEFWKSSKYLVIIID
ncbi:MAG: hypothetical protein K8R74_00885 [Bacteroidales bacterium]|nr:hypothetical protein [Bacteroidales bacterium]